MRKGQFYLFFMVIMIASLAALVPRGTGIKAPSREMARLSQNFEAEAPKAVNSAIANSSNVTAAFSDLSGSFTAYAQATMPGFGMAYALRQEQLFVGNRFPWDIQVNGQTLPANATQTLSANSTARFTINGTNYSLSLPLVNSFAAVLWTRSGNEVEVQTVG
ncbi:MAG: hypothetical protein V1735_04825 [Nanoarchaeota archaeon]